MKVLLREDVDNLGYAGEVYSVADGYGRNFLIPQGLAVKATPGVLKQAEVWRKRADARRAQLRAQYESLSARIREVTLSFRARASESGRLYGSVTTQQIADALNKQLGTTIDRHLVVTDPLRRLGTHHVCVSLSGEFHPQLTVIREPEGEVGQDEAEPAATEVVAA